MKYVVVDYRELGYERLELKDILTAIAKYAHKYIWTIQDIYAMGDIKEIVGTDYVTLEERVHSSDHGVALSFDTLNKLSEKFDDIMDITIVGREDDDAIPMAFKAADWEEQCDVIITWHDSTLWEFFSKDQEIMDIFRYFEKK